MKRVLFLAALSGVLAGCGAENADKNSVVVMETSKGTIKIELFADKSGLADRPGVSKVEADGDQVRVFTREPDGVLGELVTAGATAGLAVLDATMLKPSLETVFLTLTGREYRE